MGFLGKVIQLGLSSTVGLATDIIKDVVTLGGELTDQDEPYTVTRGKKIIKKAKNLPSLILVQLQ